MDYAYNYDMLCDAERTLSFDYIRHSRKDRLTYVASPFYSMEKSAKVGAQISYKIDSKKTKETDLFDLKER